LKYLLGIEEQIFEIFWVLLVVRVSGNITRITQTNFGFLQSLSEIVIGYFGFGYFGSRFG
jgi:hypothetical protein